jgi:hypothetical protein
MAFQSFNVKAAGRGKPRADAAIFDSDEEEVPALQGAPPAAQTAAKLQASRPIMPPRQGGSGGGATGQRAQVVPRPGDGGSNQMET